MAKLVLSIQPKDEGALKSVQALKAEVQSLSKSLSSIKINSSGVETTRKGYANLITTLKTLKSQYADGVFGDMPEQAQEGLKVMERLSAAFQKNKTLTKEETKEYAAFSQKLKKLSADLATVKAKNDKIVAANPFTVTQAQQIPRLIKQYSTLLNNIRSIEKYYPKGTFDTFKADLTQGQTDLQALNQEFQTTGTLSQESQAKLNALANAYNQVGAAVKKTETEMKSSKGTLKDIVSGFAKFQLAAMLVMKPLQWIRDALSSINETLVKTEDAVIALQRVLPTGSATDDEISSKVYDIAQRYGQTFENVSQIAQNFARTGMDWSDTIKATEAAVLALNVAELDATEASEGLISILTQFGMTAEQLTEVVDKLNKAADRNPVTTEKLLTALQRTGAAAKNANITLDETIGIITTLSKATNRSGENLGTAVNSLIQFSSKESSLNTFAKFGGDVEIAVEKFRAGAGSILEIWEELGEVIQSRESEAESILGGGLFNNEEWTSLNDELKEALGESYADITEIYNTASVFRRNYFVALLNDMDNVKKVTGEIADASGYSQAENEKYLNTYTAKLNTVKAQWQDVANDEQGILGIKKDLVDLGSGVLNIVQGLGGLKTILATIAMWVTAIVIQFKGAAILTGLVKILGVITNIATLGIPNLIKQIKTAGDVAKAVTSTVLLTITAAATILSAVMSAIKRDREEAEEEERKAREEQDAAIAKSNEKVEAQKKEVQSMEDLAASVENLRNVLDSSTASEDEKRTALEKLLQIQNSLVESNSAYKDSLDLTNGSLKEQLGLIEQLTTEQLKQKAQDFLSQNKSEIEIAQSRLTGESTTNTDMLLHGVGNDRFRFRDIIGRAIQGAGIEDFAQIIEDNVYGAYHQWGKDIADGWNDNGLWGALGGFFKGAIWTDKEDWTGEANAGFSFSGTVEEQIKAIEALQTYIADNRDELGLTAEEHKHINDELERQFELLNDDAYKEAQRLNEIAQATNDWLNGTITEAEYLEKVYGITKATADETGEWHNNIAKVTEQYDKLIDALEKLRDAEKENLDLEEKKKGYLEAQNELIKAQQALENARNEATVRRFNGATGQWEWQVDEKKVAEAEEAVKEQQEEVEQARKDLEDQAYDALIELLNKEDPPTNDELVDLLDGLEEFLGSGFVEKIKSAFIGVANVDLDQPAYDSGGIASGMGYMPKATDRPESVNDPELTAKILQPVSNEQFHRYVRDMGLLFESARQYAQTPVVERVGGNTNNSVDNRGQIIMNGVTIGSDRRSSSLDENLAIAGIVPNE